MANALVVRKEQLPSSEKARRAAQYVRMSTDKQRYSIQNQAAVIAAYAHAHDLTIVRTYADEGESGLRIQNRSGLRRLISDINTGESDYDHLLVYDVSRWGRFQDTDESAHYEFVCKQAGVKVAYCAEQFDNDGSMLSSIVKNLKRVMAAEFSRELSVKVHAAQSRIVRLGFRPGAPIGYGLQREVVDDNQQPKGLLRKGELKYLQTDRVKVRPGPAEEVAVVRWIFEQCLRGRSDTQIACELNRKEVPACSGGPWNRGVVTRILRNEAYIGNIVYNRQSRKLGARKVSNAPDLWVRGEHCFEPMIEPEVFQRVRKIIDDRRIEISEDEMLARLRRTLLKRGRLSPAIINDTSGLPGIHTYIRHFGSVRNTYRMIGYSSERDYTFIDAEQAWAEVMANIASQVAAGLRKLGRKVVFGRSKDQLCIDGRTRVLFRVARSYPREGGLTQWRIPQVDRPSAKWIVAIRLTDDNKTVRDNVLIPTKAVAGRYVGYMRITDLACVRLGLKRLETANSLARYINRGEVARCNNRGRATR